MASARVCLGQIGAPHGVRGEVRLRSFTADPDAIRAYGPLETEDGHVVQIESLRRAKDHFVARLAGVADRDAAERLKLDLEKVKAWMVKGAQPSDRVMRFLDAAGILKRAKRNNPEKAVPRKERKAKAEAAKAAADAKPKPAAPAAS